MTRQEFRELAARKWLCLDGATGTELVKRGMPPGVCPELWVLDNPEALLDVQRAYAAAGSDIVYVPSFGANPHKLSMFDAEAQTFEINKRLAELSRLAVPGKLCFGDIAPSGQMIEPVGMLGFEEAVLAYKRQVEGLLAGGVDGFAIETMMDLQETRAALIAVRELSDLPVLVTMTFEPGGRTLTGNHPVAALAAIQALGADAFGCNCSTGPEAMAALIRELKPHARIPLIAKPNAGMPKLVNGETIFDLDPAGFAQGARELLAAGAGILGGCCGTSPEYIAAICGALAGTPPPRVTADAPGLVSSGSRFRRIAPRESFVLVGERINPTGKKALQEGLRRGDFSLVWDFAVEQTEQGAEILDVNLGLAGIDPASTMRSAIGELTLATDTPLCIDSTDPAAVEAALRFYPGRALLNSISAERERLEKILPIAVRYGAMLVLLPLDDAGIPETLAARKETLHTIIRAAESAGVPRADMITDALVMTAAANPEAPEVTLGLIEHCTRELNMSTICGLSNVSFGLPRREAANCAFLAMAMGRGLNLAIANPATPGLRETLLAADALAGRDPGMEKYLAHFGETAPPKAPSALSLPPREALTDAVLRGKRDMVPGLLTALLASGAEAGALVREILIPAITEVGERFERHEYYLPQLVQSAAAMRDAMEQLEPLLLQAQNASGPLFLLATVEGDIHDIGKNIVGLMLKNHNFRVLDLGKDVSAARILAALRETGARLVGLSALMTTTMPRMKEVIDLARSAGFNEVEFLVGGAAVDPEFAASIGAQYAADAMATVRLAQKWMENTKK